MHSNFIRIFFLSLLLFPLLGLSAVKHEIVHYQTPDGHKMRGYIAFSEKYPPPRPVVIVVHEWWGLNDYAKKRAYMLAEAGYLAFAIDMYGQGKKAEHPDSAQKFAQEATQKWPIAQKRFQAALNTIQQHPKANKELIAAIGYCFGGGVVLQMARMGEPLTAVASFHGNLKPVKPAQATTLKAAIRVFNGADDKMVTTDDISAIKEEMKKANADFKLYNYPNTKHSFTNPEADQIAKQFKLPIGYNAEADKDSWQKLLEFLAVQFKRALPEPMPS
ncbi:dienelactone hydrolase family protein [Zooshikella sp. RANM57]|uniref:dienelactone hydrolase family protein n=1 Tax=Zooshikella sp. RANM57 TaxID=3425863 RepID=UPI003D6FBFE1